MLINRIHILKLWQTAKIQPNQINTMKTIANRIESYREKFYDAVETATGVPWYVVGVIDCRESNFNHSAYLGNGDSLSRKTIHVPKGRGPFKTWYDGAIDAFEHDGMPILPVDSHWDIVTALIKCEEYNGLGYAAKGLNSPYVWAGTNQQQRGKYVADGRFSATAWDTQPGCAAILLALKQFNHIDLQET